VLAVLYVFLVIFVIVDITVRTKNSYNLVSLAGIFILILIMFGCSYAPNKASTLIYYNNKNYYYYYYYFIPSVSIPEGGFKN